jgi:outer membrane lipoprotein carrier protein
MISKRWFTACDKTGCAPMVYKTAQIAYGSAGTCRTIETGGYRRRIVRGVFPPRNHRGRCDIGAGRCGISGAASWRDFMRLTGLIRNGVFLILMGGWLSTAAVMAQSQSNPPEPDLQTVIAGVEARYDVPGFTADFYQISTIKAMQISDEARGRMFVRKPQMMRWEYEQPEPQVIITNGARLWIYRPEDNQVIIGRSPAFFGDGKGAGFLADIRVLRRKFDITFADQEEPGFYVLKLSPLEQTIEVAAIDIYVRESDYAVQRVITYNPYGDETRIDLFNSQFGLVPEPDLFTFTIQEGTDVVTMDEQG